jgi:cell shape-determining protein MreC
MNEHLTENNRNHYDGNGWSKYQIMVLQQLEDHNRVLQNLNKEIADFKQLYAVSEAEYKHWRLTAVQALESLEKKMTFVLYDEDGVSQKVAQIERDIDVDKQSSIKSKAMWAIYGAVAVFLFDAAFKVFDLFMKYHK